MDHAGVYATSYVVCGCVFSGRYCSAPQNRLYSAACISTGTDRQHTDPVLQRTTYANITTKKPRTPTDADATTIQLDYYTLAEQRFTEISRLRHDIRNLMQTASILSEDCTQQQTAARLVEDIGKRLNQTKAVQFCEHPLLNTILTLKLQNKHTDLVADIVLRDISDLPMREQALCSYFVMLMDTVTQVFAQSATHGAAFGLRSGKNAHFYVVKIIFPESVALQNVRQTILQNRMLRALIEEHHGMENIATTDDFITVTMAFPLAT